MTKRFYIFMLLVLSWLGAAAKSEPYAVLSSNNKTLTFCCDEYKNSRGGMSVGPFEWEADRGWNDQCSNITTVVFDKSFAGYTELTSTAYWFYGCSVLTTITGIEHLNTANVTDMSYMFCACKALKSLDVANFNTAKVTNMRCMFSGCSALMSLDVSNFNTSNVTNMFEMFRGCKALTSLDVTNFNTAKVTNMSSMFYYCSGLTSLDVSNFNTSNVTSTFAMFSYCSALTSLDVSNFNTSNVTLMTAMFAYCNALTSLDVTNFNTDKVKDMSYMFSACPGLTTIFCYDTWNCESSESMFYGCTSLEGAIAYDENKNDVTYANPEGYFTKPVVLPYAALSEDNKTLTFYYDKYKKSRGGMDIGPFNNFSDRGWNNQCSNITTVVFDESFANYTELTSTDFWFYECSALTTIMGIEHLNTANVTYMNVMFSGCSRLTSLNVSNFNTSNVTSMNGLFAYCSSLTSLDVSNFNTSNVKSMIGMFTYCNALTSLDVTNFNTDKVKNMGDMFGGCSGLKTIYCNDAWNCESSESMFSGCTSLVGAIAYNKSKTDVTYANPKTGYFTKLVFPYALLSDDNKTLTFYYDEHKKSRDGMDVGPFNDYGEPGWYAQRANITEVVFDESFADYTELTSTAHWFYNCSALTTITGMEHLNTANVTNMFYMFCNCSSLTDLDVTHFNTANVEDMGSMFLGCSSLTSLDLLDFNTDKVTNLSGMFYECSSLKTIYCNDTWSCDFSMSMFSDCTSLKGAIEYESGKANVSYANPETGYFTKVDISPYAALSDGNKTLTFYYDKYKIRRAGMDVGPFSGDADAGWFPQRDIITTVVFDKSFADCKTLTSTAFWFYGFETLKTITGMEYLNTDNVTNMSCMLGCQV